jgi:hypothetical protein
LRPGPHKHEAEMLVTRPGFSVESTANPRLKCTVLWRSDFS